MSILITLIMVLTIPMINRDIGNGEEGGYDVRAPLFILWGLLGGLLAWSLYGESLETLYCGLYAFFSYILFRQLFSPTPAFFAGHGNIKTYLPRMNKVTNWLVTKRFGRAYSLKNMHSMHKAVNASALGKADAKFLAIQYGLKVGGLIGFFKVLCGFGILGTLFINEYAIILSVLGIGFGWIHFLNGDKGAAMRMCSERAVGNLIVSPCTVLPILFYNGGLISG